jgi:class 3 adenylate cyclase/pimeloyl-ACP methyl ester carboxylesterase
MAPETRYAKKGDISIAYQVVGDGPIDLVLVNGLVSHMSLWWSDPAANAMLRRLTSFARLIMFDKPGTGLSDPVSGPPTAEQRVEDIVAVMDAVGLDHASILGYSEGGTVSILFTAMYPERCDALVLLETAAKWLSAPDYLADDRERVDHPFELMLTLVEDWGSGRIAGDCMAPDAVSVPGSRQVFGSVERICASPGMARAMLISATVQDVRAAIPKVATPTLVIHRNDSFVPILHAQYLADNIPGARSAFFPGKNHLAFIGRWEPIVDEIEEFLTGSRHRADPDRMLATILFTDIVSSTERAAELGDERWRSLVERHEEVIHTQIDHFDGRAIKTMGDGFLAVFDGPAKAVRAAREMAVGVRELGIEIRAGVHTGECDRRGDDLGGIAVNVAARIIGHAGPGEVMVSSTVRELVLGSGLEFADRGVRPLKGIPDDWHLYAVTADRRADARPVHEVSAEVAALTPGPQETMRARDRALLAASRRAPGVMRAFGRPLLYRERPWARSSARSRRNKDLERS